MSDALFATVCSIDNDGVLHAFGEPYALPYERWTFDGWKLRCPLHVSIPAGRWHVVMGVGHEPYGHDVGVVDLGTHHVRARGVLEVDVKIDITFEPRDVKISRTPPELEAPRTSLPGRLRELVKGNR